MSIVVSTFHPQKIFTDWLSRQGVGLYYIVLQKRFISSFLSFFFSTLFYWFESFFHISLKIQMGYAILYFLIVLQVLEYKMFMHFFVKPIRSTFMNRFWLHFHQLFSYRPSWRQASTEERGNVLEGNGSGKKIIEESREQITNRQKFVALSSLVEGLNKIGHRQ